MPDSRLLSAATISPVNRPEAAPSAGRVWRPSAVLWLLVLAVYWGCLFLGTHSEARDVPSGIWDFDKALHAGAYFGLTTLVLIAARRVGSLLTWRTYAKAAVLVLAYGAFDELTQPLVGRQCELLDWLADAAGVAAAIGIDRWRYPQA